jgi:hypothetical protein
MMSSPDMLGGRDIPFADTLTILLVKTPAPTRYERIAHLEEPYGSAASLVVQASTLGVIKTRTSEGPFVPELALFGLGNVRFK